MALRTEWDFCKNPTQPYIANLWHVCQQTCLLTIPTETTETPKGHIQATIAT